MGLNSVYGIAGSALAAQSLRLNVVASNLANADSVTGPDGKAYQAKQVVFQATREAGGGSGVAASVIADPTPMKQVYDPSSPHADSKGFVTMPNVNMVEEMTNMLSAARSYQANVEMMNTVKTMMQRSLTLGQ